MNLILYNDTMFKKLKFISFILLSCLLIVNFFSNQAEATSGPFKDSIDTQNNIDECVKIYLKDKKNPSEEEKKSATEVCSNNTKCNVGLLGWLICPLFELVGNIADSSFSFLQTFFYINPENVSQKSNRASWGQVRNLANSGLVIFFLVMIFSQLTGYGLNNYSIKKALPKVIMAAVLINLSFYLSLILIDLSNIIGTSIASLFKTFENVLLAEGGTKGGVGAAILIAAVFSIAIASLQTRLLTTIFTMLFAFIITVIITLLFLIAREAIAVILIIMSPIAFLALIFPNAENIYKTWKKGMTVVCMMFPIMGMLFGASSLVSAILARSNNGIITQALAFIMSAMPMVFAPNLVKSAIASMPLVGSKISNTLGKFQNWSNKKFNNSGYMTMRKKRDQFRTDQVNSGQYRGKNIFLRGNSKLQGVISNKTLTGQARLDEINQRANSQIDSLSDRLSESDSVAIQAAIAAGNSSINTTGLSASARQAIAAAGLTGNDMSQLAMAGALGSAKRGSLDSRSYDEAMLYASKNGGVTKSSISDLSEKIRVASSNKGRYDTSSYIAGLQKNNQLDSNMATRNANRQTYMKEGFEKLNSDDLVIMNYKTLDNGSDGQAVFKALYHSEPLFANTVKTAQANAEMSARTSRAMENAK
ncbi:MAG: O-antigen polymerase [Candidatus Saccharibacteria bacterium]|nr:O-antigen polymerase [Candidatus Saccharibacteria bacterium]